MKEVICILNILICIAYMGCEPTQDEESSIAIDDSTINKVNLDTLNFNFFAHLAHCISKLTSDTFVAEDSSEILKLFSNDTSCLGNMSFNFKDSIIIGSKTTSGGTLDDSIQHHLLYDSINRILYYEIEIVETDTLIAIVRSNIIELKRVKFDSIVFNVVKQNKND